MGETVTIKALKYLNKPHFEWEGEVLEINDEFVLVLCKKGRKLIHHSKGKVFTIDNTSLELFFFKEWYTVSMSVEQDIVQTYYCNIAMPSAMRGNEITFVDLDLDLVKYGTGDWQVVDEDEFKLNSQTFNYPIEIKENAILALARLKEKAIRGEFPFDELLLHFLHR